MASRADFHKVCKQKKNAQNLCLAIIGYQPTYHTFTIAATGIPLISCLAKKFGKQNNSFVELGPVYTSVFQLELHIFRLRHYTIFGVSIPHRNSSEVKKGQIQLLFE